MSTNQAEAGAARARGDVRPDMQPYGGYYANHIPAHDPELTETGPGTPMGEYMRRFWHKDTRRGTRRFP